MDAKKERIEELMDKYANMVYRLAMTRTGNKENSEDVFQEVFLRVSQKVPEFQSEEHEKAWMIRVTINCSKNLLNSFWNRKVDSLSEEIPFVREESQGIWMLVQKLPQKYRTVIYLYYQEGYKIREISKILKTKEATVKTWLSRAKDKLQKEWEGGMEDA